MNTVKKQGAKNALKIQDMTFRDGHQSNLATRMRTDDMIPIAEQMDEIGFWSMEVWGGATFDTMHRFLAEDPWERPKILKKHLKKTQISMLLRGQNLVGYRNYADDVVRAFVDKACEVGIDIFMVFDALNDFRNFQTAVERIKANGKHFSGNICYSLTERTMGGDVFNLEYYVSKCKQLEEMGADTIRIKDMAGLIAPYDIYTLVTELKKVITIPIHLHTHYTSGMASMSYLKAVEAGVDIVDTCLAPFAMRTAMPAIEPLVVALQGTQRDTGLDLNKLLKLDDYMETVAPKYRDYLATNRMAVIDTGVLAHQIPGGMISNLVSQLKEANALHRLPEVHAEIPITRKELGTPPLVTPTSQIVGVQAVLNVLLGKYKMVTNQVKDLVYGLYGRTPTPVDPEVQKIVLKGYKRGETPITGRAADYLEPELDKIRERLGDLAKTEEDVLTGALYPTTGEQFLKWKYGLEEKPDHVKPKTLDHVKREDEAVKEAIEKVKAESRA
ncbi:MAG: pyruvate carboxylase subunit B [Desulfobacterales bacterium]|nr:pyruvate carboxylase subunit B [Desulfobacterales bacterium]